MCEIVYGEVLIDPWRNFVSSHQCFIYF